MTTIKITGEVWDLQEQCAAVINANEDVELVINSPGGDVFNGLQMVHAIQDCHYKVTAKIEVMAASIAAVIALACDAVQIDKNSLLMLHNCWTFTAGNKEELQQEIDAMAAIDTIIHNIVEEHCYDDSIGERMDSGDVWLTGEDAAELFDIVELVEKEQKHELAACASLVKLVKLSNMLNKNEGKPEEEEPAEEPEAVPEEPEAEPEDPEEDPEEEPAEEPDPDEEEPEEEKEKKAEYVVPEGLKALLDEAARLG